MTHHALPCRVGAVVAPAEEPAQHRADHGLVAPDGFEDGPVSAAGAAADVGEVDKPPAE
ncbi:MAG: hypothetical protein M3Y73_08910 [Actinomycetota bacterium]|nr:hypothetical protein [Actinomycetota bacterium]